MVIEKHLSDGRFTFSADVKLPGLGSAISEADQPRNSLTGANYAEPELLANQNEANPNEIDRTAVSICV